MSRLNIILKNIYKKKAIYFLISIQVMVSIWLLLTRVDAMLKINNVGKDIESTLSKKPDKIVHMTFADDATYPEDFLKFRDEVIGKGYLDYVASYSSSMIPINEFKNNKKYKEMIKKLKIKKEDLYFDGAIKSLDIEEGIDNLMNFDVIKGRKLETRDFNWWDEKKEEKIVSVLAGFYLYEQGLLDIGTRLTSQDSDGIVYEVVGILEKDSPWFYSIMSNNQIMHLNDKLITPIDEKGSYVFDMLLDMYYYGEMNQDKSSEYILSRLKESANKYELNNKVEFETVQDVIDDEKEEVETYYKSYLIFSVLFFIIITFAITVLISLLLNSRKYEVGIRFSLGASNSDIKKMFLGEILFVNILSTLIVICIYSLFNQFNFRYDDIVNKMNIEPLTFLYILLGVSFMCAVPAFIITKRLSKLNPAELVGGRE